MLETPPKEWLARLRGNAPRLTSLALAALIAVEAARIAILLFSANPVKSPHPVFANPAVRPLNPSVGVQNVVSAHLFGIYTAERSAQDTENAPESTANLVLAGTIASQDPQRGVAIISDGGPARVYSVGDNVGGATLHSVYLDHVILDRAGTLETLLLPKLLGPGMRAPPVVRRTGGGDPHTAAAVDNIRRMVQQDPGILDQVMRTVASFDNAAGKLRGFRAYPGKNRQIFGKLGLKAGDLVTAINGTPLDDPQRSQDVFNTIQNSDHVTVTVERGGQKQDITLNIAQVAAQATRDLEGDGSSPAGGGPPDRAAPPPPPFMGPSGSSENPTE